MLDIKVTEKPKNIIDKILTIKAQLAQLVEDYQDKIKGEVFNKRRAYLFNKAKSYKRSLGNIGKAHYKSWILKGENLNTNETNIYSIQLPSDFDTKDVVALMLFHYNINVLTITPDKELRLGELNIISKEK